MAVKFKKEWLFYGAGVFALAFSAMAVTRSQPKETRTEPVGVINPTPYANSIATTGVVEPVSEAITVAPDIDGVITEIHVRPGDKVRKGAPLFSLDNRRQFAEVQKAAAQLQRAEAETALREAERRAAEAAAEMARVTAARLRTTVERYRPLRPDAISDEDFDKLIAEAEEAVYTFRAAQESARSAAASLSAAKADAAIASANVAEAQAALSRTVMRSPIDGAVLKVAARAGEPVRPSDREPASVTVGDITSLMLKVEIDEAVAGDFAQTAEATAFLRAAQSGPIGLSFESADAMLRPKANFRDAASEYVDSRVLEVRYRIAKGADASLYVGQLLDVYINADAPPGGFAPPKQRTTATSPVQASAEPRDTDAAPLRP
jgi:multidrug efflux pump subunit AcrA (membrane-fusion protein)